MQTNAGLFEEWKVQKDKYIDVVTKGGAAIDYDQDWINGRLAVKAVSYTHLVCR